MNTIQKLIREKQGLPESMVWYLNDLAEAAMDEPERQKSPGAQSHTSRCA